MLGPQTKLFMLKMFSPRCPGTTLEGVTLVEVTTQVEEATPAKVTTKVEIVTQVEDATLRRFSGKPTCTSWETSLPSTTPYFTLEQYTLIMQMLKGRELESVANAALVGTAGKDVLPWSTRVQIAMDSARGLEYIRSLCYATNMRKRDKFSRRAFLDECSSGILFLSETLQS
ncbi:hypothetical protein HAX54_019440 [Datura stramonium]|uniref:Uncharacterized protein n=1 Tax=Datura stramonium TaxID=4076 RepID=A0ABS8UPX3_DATST|nr:hypothetical protein [Datura stramonium]